VPSGRVLKGEAHREAVHRVAESELGIDVETLETFKIEHIPREQNKEDDALVEQAFDN